MTNARLVSDEETVLHPDNPHQSGTVFIRVSLPEKDTQKCLQFQLDEMVGRAKEIVLVNMGQDLKDSMNYGLYCPPMDGKAGKFLQEERPLRDYPLNGPIGFLEFKYKRRVYRTLNVNPSKLKKLHTKNNLKQFIDAVKSGDVNKVVKWTNKGIDPNFHCRDSGETPLCLAAHIPKPRELIMALVSGGSHLDFRAQDSLTPLHRAAQAGNYEAIRTLLDLGQSPNCRDARGLTPLYYTVVHDTPSICTERLLYDHSVLGVVDEQGLQEIHQACKLARVQHLEHLLSYGAEINCVTSNGNTPLHICAYTGQDACSRLLLFRGAERSLVNGNGQTAYQVAILHNHVEVADTIHSYKQEDVVPIRAPPNFNEKRRSSIPSLRATHRSVSLTRLHELGQGGSMPASPSGTVSTAAQVQRTNISNSSPARRPLLGMKVGGRGGHGPLHGLGVSGSVSKSVSNLSGLGAANGAGVAMSYNWDNESSYGSVSSASSLRGHFASDRPDGFAANGHNHSTLLPLLSNELGELVNFPRTIVLQKGAKGYGFVLRGAKDIEKLTNFHPTAESPALQYLEKVEDGSPSDRAGLRAGDFILEINNENVVTASHERCVALIRQSNDTLALKVMTVDRSRMQQTKQVLDELDNTLAQFEDSRSLALRESARGTASVSNRLSRKMTDVELQEIFARGGRDELPEAKLTKPDIPQAPRLYSSDADIRAKLKANISNSKSASQITTTALISSPIVAHLDTPYSANLTYGAADSSAVSVSENAGSDSGVSFGGSEGSPAISFNRINSSNPPSYLATLPRDHPSESSNRTSIITIAKEAEAKSHLTAYNQNSTFRPLTAQTANQSEEKFYTAPSNRLRVYPALKVPEETQSTAVESINMPDSKRGVAFAQDKIYDKYANLLLNNENATLLVSSEDVLSHLPPQLAKNARVEVLKETSPTVTTNYTNQHAGPTPDYSSSGESSEEDKPAAPGTLQAALQAAAARMNSTKVAAKTPSPPAPPAPTMLSSKVAQSVATTLPTPKAPPAPPAPPVPPVLSAPPAPLTPSAVKLHAQSQATSESLTPQRNSSSTSSVKPDHNASLFAAIQKRRTDLDSGLNPAECIEADLRRRQGTGRSIIVGGAVKSAGVPTTTLPQPFVPVPPKPMTSTDSVLITPKVAPKVAVNAPPPVAAKVIVKPNDASTPATSTPSSKRPSPPLPPPNSISPVEAEGVRSGEALKQPHPPQESYRSRAEEMRAKLLQRQRRSQEYISPEERVASKNDAFDEHDFVPPPDSFKDKNSPITTAISSNNTFFIGSRTGGSVVKEFANALSTPVGNNKT